MATTGTSTDGIQYTRYTVDSVQCTRVGRGWQVSVT